MNKKISLYVLALGLMASAGVDARRSIRSSGTTASVKSNTVSSSLVSGIGLKYFKNSSITLVENRSVNIEPIMFTNNLTNIQTRSGKDPSFKLCFACDDIVLQYEQGEKLDSNASPYDGLQCYSIPEGSKNIRLTVKPGAIEHCGSRTRMTINDVRAVDKGLAPEVDSVVLNIVKNSSAYDFSNLGFEVDKDILDLVKNYDDAKEKVKKECGKIDMEKLNTIQGLMIASTATSGTSILASGAAAATSGVAAYQSSKMADGIQKADVKSGDDTDVVEVETVQSKSSTVLRLETDISNWQKDIEYNKTQIAEYQQEIHRLTTELMKDDVSDEKFGELQAELDQITDFKVALEEKNVQYEINIAEAQVKINDENRSMSKQQSTSLSGQKAKVGSGTEKGNPDPARQNAKTLAGISAGASSLGATANLAGSITAFISVGQMNDIISQVQKCRDAGREMHNAGLALEEGLKDITSADDI